MSQLPTRICVYIKILIQSNIISFTSVIFQEWKSIQTWEMHYCWSWKCEELASHALVSTQTYICVMKRHVSGVFSWAQLQSMSHIYLTCQVLWMFPNTYTQYKIRSIQTCSFAIVCYFLEHCQPFVHRTPYIFTLITYLLSLMEQSKPSVSSSKHVKEFSHERV